MIIYFILIFTTTAKGTEETKYIDLLPEKEKEILLERIARRILDEVDSKPVQQKSLDVTKDELDVHSEFVKKILQEEEANLRKHNLNDKEDLSVKPLDENKKNIDLTIRGRTRRNSNGSFEANSDLENNGVQSDVKTRIIKDPGKSDEKDIQIKHFSVKANVNDPKVESKVNNNNVTTISTDRVTEETEKPISEDQDRVDKVTNNTFHLTDADELKIKTNHTDETIQSLLNDTKLTTKAEENKSFSQRSQNINRVNKSVESDNTSTEIHASKTEITTKQVKESLRNRTFLDIPIQILREDVVRNVGETSSKASTEPTTEEVTYTTIKKMTDTVETATVKNELEPKENIKRVVNTVTDKIESHTEITDDGTEASSNSLDTFKINITDSNITNNNLFINVQTPKPSIDVDSKTIRAKPLTKKHISYKNAEIVSASIENKDILSEVNPELITEDTILKEKRILKSDPDNIKRDDNSVKPDISHVKNINQRDTKHVETEFEVTTQKVEVLTPLVPLTLTYNTNNNIKQTKTVDSNIIQVLRDVIDRNKVKANGRFDGLKSISKVKEHKVYEIPKEKTLDKDDIIITNKEQPYYYPIYNYSPNNAYYNAHNNLGPNPEDLGIQRVKNQDQMISNFQTDYFFDYDENNRKVKFPYSNGSEYTKDKDHLKLPVVVNYPFNLITDEDLDISRSRSMKKQIEENKLKSSLREIRMMMYAKKQFGYVPENRTYTSVEADCTTKINLTEVTTEKSNLRVKFEAILKREKNERQNRITTDDSNISIDHYNRMDDNSKTNKIKQQNINIPILNDLQNLIDKNNYKIYLIDPFNLKPKTKKKYIARNEENKPNFAKIKEILSMANDVDVIPTLNTLLKMNITRSGVKERDIDIYVDVLTDMVQTDNEALEQYDWMGTTVNIQAATLKILELMQLVQQKKYINPSDLELLKYIIYLFKEANVINQHNEELRMKSQRRKHMKRKLLKTKGLIDRVWLYRQSIETKNMYKLTKKDMEILGQFLDELLNSLYELHTAVKEIASITKYNRQHWFKNLKELYLNRTRGRTLELLLHLTANRVLDLVENSARNGLENDYLKYLKLNKNEVGRTVNELVFLMKILKEIER